MSQRPVSPGEDYAVVVDGLDTGITVELLNPDTNAVTSTSTNATVLQKRDSIVTIAAGDGEVGATICDFTIIASTIDFTPRARTRITDADGTKWITDDVSPGGFNELYHCRGCVKQRS